MPSLKLRYNRTSDSTDPPPPPAITYIETTGIKGIPNDDTQCPQTVCRDTGRTLGADWLTVNVAA